jgi:hypothetical protein
MNNTIENNKLISEFMGLTIITDEISFFDTNYKPLKKYHTDWNCLMEVVGKIENYNEYTSVLFFPQGCAIVCFIENGFSFSNDCDTKIEAVYNACVEFIKWCYKQK